MILFLKHPLVKAVLISGLVHGLFLWFSAFPPPVRLVQPLMASFQQGVPSADVSSLSDASSSVDPAPTKKNISPPSSKQTHQSVLSSASGDHSQPVAPTVATDSARTAVNAQSAGTSAVTGVSSNTVAARAESGESPDPDVLRDYRFRLAKQAQKFRRYPALARQRGWEGQVELVLHYAVHAGVRVLVSRSSSHELLDQQAVDMIQSAFNSTELPATLKSKPFRLVLPIEFRLSED